MEVWDGTERRRRPRRRGEHTTDGCEPVSRDEFDDAMLDYQEAQQRMIHAELSKALEEIMNAFPDGPENHRLAHEKMMKAAEAEEKFWSDLKGKIAEKSIWGILQILMFLAAAGIAAKFGINLLPLFGDK